MKVVVDPAGTFPVSKDFGESPAVTVCVTLSLLVTVTVVPAATLRFAGENEKFWIVIMPPVAVLAEALAPVPTGVGVLPEDELEPLPEEHPASRNSDPPAAASRERRLEDTRWSFPRRSETWNPLPPRGVVRHLG